MPSDGSRSWQLVDVRVIDAMKRGRAWTRLEFSRGECVGIALLLLLISAVVLLAGYRFSEVEQRQLFDTRSQEFIGAASARVSDVRSFVKSVRGLHYASDEFAGTDVEAFVNQLRQYSPYVRSLGMFRDVGGETRADFENWMAGKGIPGFRIHEFDANGKRIESPARRRHLPIVTVDPIDDARASILGSDFGSDPTVSHMLDMAVRSGKKFIVPTPAGWPLPSDFLLMQPVYLGANEPSGADERMRAYAGGIWASIDVREMVIEDLTRDLPGAIRATVYSEGLVARDVQSGRFLPAPDGLDVGFAELTMRHSWHLGLSRISVRLRHQPTMPVKRVVQTLSVAAAIIIGLGLLVWLMASKRWALRERYQSLRAIAIEREKAERTLESISDAVIALTPDRRIDYMNPSARRFLGFCERTVRQRPLESCLDIVAADDSNGPPFQGMARTLERLPPETQVEYDVNLDLPHLQGSTVKLSLTRVSGSDGGMEGAIMVLEDVSKERKLASELEYRASHDSLTSVFNRFYFERRLQTLMDDQKLSQREHALCYIDLDQFKVVNDTCGHEVGDRLLIHVTRQIQGLLRKGDVLARLGGDEFGVLICDASPDDAMVVATKIHQFFRHYVFEHHGKAFAVRASLGLVGIPPGTPSMSAVLAGADIACYAAKDSGRNALVVYDDDDASVNDRREEMNWLPILQGALERDRFRLLVQPIGTVTSDGASKSIDHYEFLLRLVGDAGEEITPFQFIQAAERYDLMNAIDRWVVRHAVSSVAKMIDVLPPRCTFSINVSGQSMSDPDLLSYVKAEIANSGVAPSHFWFEVTETAAISQFGNAVGLIQGLRGLGCKVALDDFGSGLSSFGYLKELPVDMLKIDGQFVMHMDTDPVAREMVRAIDSVGKVMGLETVAEFVESRRIVDELSRIGVNYAQGYFIGKPCTLADALARESDHQAA